MGYPSRFKGYLVLNLEDNSFYTSRNGTFRENIFPFQEILTKQSSDISVPKIEFYNTLLNDDTENHISSTSGTQRFTSYSPKKATPENHTSQHDSDNINENMNNTVQDSIMPESNLSDGNNHQITDLRPSSHQNSVSG